MTFPTLPNFTAGDIVPTGGTAAQTVSFGNVTGGGSRVWIVWLIVAAAIVLGLYVWKKAK